MKTTKLWHFRALTCVTPMYLLVWLLGPDRFLSPLPSSRVQASGNSFSTISTLDLLVLAMFNVCQRWSSQVASGSHFKHSTDRFKHNFVHKPALHAVSCYTCTPNSINIRFETNTQDTAQCTNFKLNSFFLSFTPTVSNIINKFEM